MSTPLQRRGRIEHIERLISRVDRASIQISLRRSVESPAMPPPLRRKDNVIQIRASAEAKSLLNRAAALRGQKLSEFMLESARQQAEETILDQRTFFLDDDAHARFLALLNSPPKPSAKARARLNRKAPWEE